MARASVNESPEQNGAVSALPFSVAHCDPDSDGNGVPEETLSPLEAAAQEIEQLRAENTTLRDMLDEVQKLLEEKLQAEQAWIEQQKEHETLLEEKSEVIRELHLKLQERAAASVSAPPPPREAAATPREEELLALSDELEQERRQLKEDEETLMAQMREMEVQMSRERADLARQRNELQRLHSEIHHELELATRHAALRDRLQPLQRRHQEMLHRKGGSEPPREAPAATPDNQAPAPPQKAPPRDSSGLLRRLFG